MERKEIQEINENLAGKSPVKKFMADKPAMAGSVFVLLVFILSVFGYFLSPDPTPYANRQMVEIMAKKPGHAHWFLMARHNAPYKKTPFLRRLAYGAPDNYKYQPVDTFFIQDFHLFYHPTGAVAGYIDSIALIDLLYPVDYSVQSSYFHDTVNFFQIEKGMMATSKSDLQQGSKGHIVRKVFLLGSDRFGRDMLGRMIIGARISLSVGAISVLISLGIGLILGLTAGYFGGMPDKTILFFINVMWSVPALLMALALSMVMGKGYWQLFLAIGLTMWVEVARVVRGQVLSVREKDYITAARVLGIGNLKILARHVLPNIINPVIIICAANFSTAILLEAGLSFLGIGIQPPVPSWGGMIRDHYGYIIVDQAYLAIIPGLAIIALVLSFTFIGNGLRDALNPD